MITIEIPAIVVLIIAVLYFAHIGLEWVNWFIKRKLDRLKGKIE